MCARYLAAALLLGADMFVALHAELTVFGLASMALLLLALAAIFEESPAREARAHRVSRRARASGTTLAPWRPAAHQVGLGDGLGQMAALLKTTCKYKKAGNA